MSAFTLQSFFSIFISIPYHQQLSLIGKPRNHTLQRASLSISNSHEVVEWWEEYNRQCSQLSCDEGSKLITHMPFEQVQYVMQKTSFNKNEFSDLKSSLPGRSTEQIYVSSILIECKMNSTSSYLSPWHILIVFYLYSGIPCRINTVKS